jgi:hypothetical protein
MLRIDNPNSEWLASSPQLSTACNTPNVYTARGAIRSRTAYVDAFLASSTYVNLGVAAYAINEVAARLRFRKVAVSGLAVVVF